MATTIEGAMKYNKHYSFGWGNRDFNSICLYKKYKRKYRCKTGIKAEMIGLPIPFQTWCRYSERGEELMEMLLKFTPEEWENFVITETIGNL